MQIQASQCSYGSMALQISIIGSSLFSPLGAGKAEQLEAIYAGNCALQSGPQYPLGRLAASAEAALSAIALERAWRQHDRVTQLAGIAARQAVAHGYDSQDLAVLMGSSRGASQSLAVAWEKFAGGAKLRPQSSPITTAGTLATAIAQDLHAQGLALSLSAACTTGLHAIGLAATLIQSGQIGSAIAGGAEAPVTDFNLAMLAATGVLAGGEQMPFPCRPFHPTRQGMVLAEGAACVYLGRETQNAPIAIVGYGAATESATLTGVSADGDGLLLAMQRALDQAAIASSDLSFIAGHGAGTIKGDASELRAYQRLCGLNLPPLSFSKWATGHMLAASPAAMVVLAAEYLQSGRLPPHPYFSTTESPLASVQLLGPKPWALVTALGFGGSAAAIVLKRRADCQSIGVN